MEKILNIIGVTAESFMTFLSGMVIFAIGLFYPVISLIYFAGFLIFLDLVTGIWAAMKRGESFNSKKLSRSWAKILLYPLGIILSYFSEFLLPEIPFIKGCTFLLIVIEGKSLEENFSEILGVPFIKYFRAFILKGKKGLLEEMEKNNND